MLLLLGLLKLLLLKSVLIRCLIGFALLHEDLIYRFDVDIVPVAVVVLAFVGVEIVGGSQIQVGRFHGHGHCVLLMLLVQLLVLVVGHHHNAIGRIQDVGLLTLKRKIDKLLCQIGDPVARSILAFVAEPAHRCGNLDVTELLLNIVHVVVVAVVVVVIRHQGSWNVDVVVVVIVVLADIVDPEDLLRASAAFGEFVLAL